MVKAFVIDIPKEQFEEAVAGAEETRLEDGAVYGTCDHYAYHKVVTADNGAVTRIELGRRFRRPGNETEYYWLTRQALDAIQNN